MIEIKNLHAYYGPLEALKGIDLIIRDGLITSIIGSNGAGKTTLLKSISGMVHRTGSITLNGEELISKKPDKIAQKGIIHVPEGRHPFPGLSVETNLETGTINWHGFFGRESYAKDMEEVFNLFPRLRERRKQLSWSLSGGEQQMLVLGRGLMGRPKFLLLDEPSMGLAPIIIKEVSEKILEINKTYGIPILLVEQNARMVMRISDYSYVLEGGRITLEGESKILKDDKRIVEAYLGKLANPEKDR